MKKPIIGVTPLFDQERDSYWMLPGYLEGLEQAPLEPPWRATGPEPWVSFSLWKFQRLMTPA